MHILFLSDNFPPEVNAPASRTFEHCRTWIRAGHSVTVITCAPNFPKGVVFKGYKNQLWKSEFIDGIRVVRVWTFISSNKGFFKRILDYLSFMSSAIIASIFVNKVDLVIGTSPQFFTACAARIVGGLKRIPWVFEVRDIWPEAIHALGAIKESVIFRLLVKLEMSLYKNASLIIVVTNSFKKILENRGVSGDKVFVITNGVDLSRFHPRIKDFNLIQELAYEGQFVAGYIGTHGLAHKLETLLDAAYILKHHVDGKNIKILFLGDGACKGKLTSYAKQLKLDNVIFLDSVSKEQVSLYWSLLDIAIIHLRKIEIYLNVIPSKLFECMAMGIPILHGVAGESAEIVKLECVGELFEPENAEQLAKSLLRLKSNTALLEEYRQNGPKAALQYDRGNLAAKMLALLDELVIK